MTEAGRLAYFEWSVDEKAWRDGKIVGDEPEAWAQANPALGTRISAEYIESEMAAMGGPRSQEWARERLGVGTWPSDEATRFEVIGRAAWEALADAESQALDPLAFGVDVTPDRSASAVAVAGRRADGLVHVELVAHQPGTGWVVPWVVERNTKWRPAAVAVAAGAAATVAEDLAAEGVEVSTPAAAEWARACGQLFDAATDARSLRVRPHPDLDKAVGGAKKRPVESGAAWTWARQGLAVDLSPLVAVTLAHWALVSRPDYDPLDSVF